MHILRSFLESSIIKTHHFINYQKRHMWDWLLLAAISHLKGTVIVIVEVKWRCSSDPHHDNGFGFDRWMTGRRKRGMLWYRPLRPHAPASPTHAHTDTHICAHNAYTDSSPASRPPLIEMEERCGRSKCLQMTRLEWIGSCALVMLLHLHQTERKTDGFHGRRLGGAGRQVGEDRQWWTEMTLNEITEKIVIL